MSENENARKIDRMAHHLADRAVQHRAAADPSWRAHAPKYGPDDVRLMMAHPTGSSPQNADNPRVITLDAEVAATGDNLFRLEMSPVQFAELVASRATVVHSVSPVAGSREAFQADPWSTWFRPGDRVYPRSGGQVLTVAEVQPIEGSQGRQQFRPEGAQGSFRWLHSDEYRLDTSKPSGPMCTRCVGHTFWDGKAWQHLDPRTAAHDVGEHAVSFVPREDSRNAALVAALRAAVAWERAAGDGSYASEICDLVDKLAAVS